MTPKSIDVAIREAKRFIERAQAAKAALEDPMVCITGSKETGACRRASMDLTRALADMRRANS